MKRSWPGLSARPTKDRSCPPRYLTGLLSSASDAATNIPLGDYVRRQSRDYEDEAVTEEYNRYQAKFGRADEIARRMMAQGPAPQGDHKAFMARFIATD
jgi:hypothetical protein